MRSNLGAILLSLCLFCLVSIFPIVVRVPAVRRTKVLPGGGRSEFHSAFVASHLTLLRFLAGFDCNILIAFYQVKSIRYVALVHVVCEARRAHKRISQLDGSRFFWGLHCSELGRASGPPQVCRRSSRCKFRLPLLCFLCRNNLCDFVDCFLRCRFGLFGLHFF